jgi:hypothetical protein
MRINPGGRLDAKDVVGRDKEIDLYWSILARQGLVLSAERRIGKTHIVRKMQEEAPPPFLCFYQDLEGVHSVRELLRSVYDTVNIPDVVGGRRSHPLGPCAADRGSLPDRQAC